MPRLFRFLAPLALIALLVALPATASADPEATAAKKCGLSRGEQRGGLGTTYVLKLKVSGAGCRKAKKSARLYHKCRKGNGGADGRCRRFRGFRCKEKRYNKSRFSFDAAVTCRKGGVAVSQRYTQNT